MERNKGMSKKFQRKLHSYIDTFIENRESETSQQPTHNKNSHHLNENWERAVVSNHVPQDFDSRINQRNQIHEDANVFCVI